ncbi:FliM/FliN family flagellar motor switch protein [Hahella chejuensis]|nr:FliM/FliN family flagellar motor switch protein [Hahella chejuensis]
MIKPVKPPRLGRTQMTLDNLICARRRPFALQLPEHIAQFSLRRLDMLETFVSVAFYAEGRRGHLHLDVRAVSALLGEEQDASIYPDALLSALLTAQLNGPLHALSSALQTELELDEISQDSTMVVAGVRIGMQISASGNTGLGLLTPPPHLAERMAALLATLPAETAPTPVTPTASAQVLLAERRMSLNDVKCLRTGDVLMLPPGASADLVTLRLPGYGACRARLDDHKLVLVTPMTSDTQHTPEPLDAPSDLGNLELKLEFHLGSLNLTLAELSQMTEGAAFDLGLSLEAPVAMKVNGQTLARCELVEIDGRLGARVVRLTGGDSEVEGHD